MSSRSPLGFSARIQVDMSNGSSSFSTLRLRPQATKYQILPIYRAIADYRGNVIKKKAGAISLPLQTADPLISTGASICNQRTVHCRLAPPAALDTIVGVGAPSPAPVATARSISTQHLAHANYSNN
jgi:hypothetical protein